MNNKEWIDLLSKEFHVSRTTAKEMLHKLLTMKKIQTMAEERAKEDESG